MTFIPTLRGVEAPPNTPAAVVKVLEDAFRKAAAEQGFAEVAQKRKIVLQPVGSAEYAKAVSDVYPRIAKLKDMLKK
jgi:tripartite-type tricarboxylate transporter receptor subunit TctC